MNSMTIYSIFKFGGGGEYSYIRHSFQLLSKEISKHHLAKIKDGGNYIYVLSASCFCLIDC